jgi:putative copper resistance protein D
MIEWLSVLLRALGFIAMFQAAGAAVFLTLFGSRVPVAAAPIVRLARIVTVLAIALVLAHYSLEAARLGGDFSAVFDGQLQQLAWKTAPGTAVCLRVSGLLLVMAGLARTGGRFASGALSIVGALVLVAAFTRIGHTVDHPHRFVLASLLAVHLVSVTFWFGALWPLRQVVTLETSATAAAVLERFSRIAIWMVPGLLLAGASLVLLLVPGFAVFAQPYGQLLLFKMAGFSVLLGFGALNKLRLTPALRQNVPSASGRLQRSLAIEYLIIGGVLTITAVMTGIYSPD